MTRTFNKFTHQYLPNLRSVNIVPQCEEQPPSQSTAKNNNRVDHNQQLLPDEDIYRLDNQRSSPSHPHRRIKSDNQQLLPDEDVYGLDNQRSSPSHPHRHIKSDNELRDLPLNQRRSPHHQPSASGQHTASADSSLTSRHSGAPTRREEVRNTSSHRCINDHSPPRRNRPPNLNNNRRRSLNSSLNNKTLPKKLSLPHWRSLSCTKSLHLQDNEPLLQHANRPNPAGAPHLVELRTEAPQGAKRQGHTTTTAPPNDASWTKDRPKSN